MRSGETPDWAVDAAVESAQAARARRAETVRAVCAEMDDRDCECGNGWLNHYSTRVIAAYERDEVSHKAYVAKKCAKVKAECDRILAAHEREMAAVIAERDAEILRRETLEREIRRMHDCCDALEDEMDAKDAAHRQWRENYHAQLAAKDSEIAQLVTECNRLKAALKPLVSAHNRVAKMCREGKE